MKDRHRLGTGLLGQEVAEPAKHALPAGTVVAAGVAARAEAVVAQRQPRAVLHCFQRIGNGGDMIAVPRRYPGDHQAMRRLDLEILAADMEIAAVSALAFRAPGAAGPDIGRVFRRAVHVVRAPPERDLVPGGDGAEDALRRHGDRHRGKDGAG